MPTTLRTPELDDLIVDGLSEGVPLRQLARDHGFGKSAFYEWCLADSAFAGRIARAREQGYDALAESILDIADDGQNDWMEKFGREGESLGWALNGEHVQRSKLRVDARLKLLAKWSPKYSDKLDVAHSGGVIVEIAKLG